jgi:hypothetical protein
MCAGQVGLPHYLSHTLSPFVYIFVVFSLIMFDLSHTKRAHCDDSTHVHKVP